MARSKGWYDTSSALRRRAHRIEHTRERVQSHNSEPDDSSDGENRVHLTREMAKSIFSKARAQKREQEHHQRRRHHPENSKIHRPKPHHHPEDSKIHKPKPHPNTKSKRFQEALKRKKMNNSPHPHSKIPKPVPHPTPTPHHTPRSIPPHTFPNPPQHPHIDPNSNEFKLGFKKKKNSAEVLTARRFQEALKRKKMNAKPSSPRPNIAIGEHDPTSPHPQIPVKRPLPHRPPHQNPIPIPPPPTSPYTHPTTTLKKGELRRPSSGSSNNDVRVDAMRRRLNQSRQNGR